MCLASGVCCQLFSDPGLGMQEQEGAHGGSKGWRRGEEKDLVEIRPQGVWYLKGNQTFCTMEKTS